MPPHFECGLLPVTKVICLPAQPNLDTSFCVCTLIKIAKVISAVPRASHSVMRANAERAE